MTTSIGELISQIRNQSKVVNQDNRYISDRLIYSLIRKHFSLFIYREDSKMKVSKLKFLYTVLPCVELVEVDKIEAQCCGISSGCTIRRTKNELPPVFSGYSSPLLGDVTSLDGSMGFVMTTPAQYLNKMSQSDARYNKTKYFWVLGNHLYFPNIEWDAVKIEVVPDAVDFDECGVVDPCAKVQDLTFACPPYLLSTIQAEVLKDIGFLLQAPSDQVVDKQSVS